MKQPGGGLFGQKPATAMSLEQQPQQREGLFGQIPAATGSTVLPGQSTAAPAFGVQTATAGQAATAPSTGSLFDRSSATSQPQLLFGATPSTAAPGSLGGPKSAEPSTAVPGSNATTQPSATAQTSTASTNGQSAAPLFSFTATKPAASTTTGLFGDNKPAFTTASGDGKQSLSLFPSPKPADSAAAAIPGPKGGFGEDKKQATASLPPSVTFPSTIKNKTLEEILLGWKEELDRQTHTFQSTAVSLASTDRKVTANAERIISLASKVATQEARHRDLLQSIEYVRMQQGELESILDKLESDDLPRMAQALGADSLVGPSDAQLGEAEGLHEDTHELSRQVAASIRSINASSSEHAGPMSDIVRILNAHLDSIRWIDEQIEDGRHEAAETTKLGDRIAVELARRGY